MSHDHGTDCGGVRNLLRLRDRCTINDETGCWHWKLSISQGVPRVDVVHPATGKRVKMRGRRAALVLQTGTDLPKGHSAFAAWFCKSADCVNPEHARSGTREQEGKALARSGRAKGSYARIQANRENIASRRKLTPAQVQMIRRGEKTDRAYADEFGVSRYAVWSAKKGWTHKRVPLAATSVFEWRG